MLLLEIIRKSFVFSSLIFYLQTLFTYITFFHSWVKKMVALLELFSRNVFLMNLYDSLKAYTFLHLSCSINSLQVGTSGASSSWGKQILTRLVDFTLTIDSVSFKHTHLRASLRTARINELNKGWTDRLVLPHIQTDTVLAGWTLDCGNQPISHRLNNQLWNSN